MASSLRDRVIAGSLASAAFVWHAGLMTRATNDNFLHLTLAQQWLHGDWPVRDFFEHGLVLEYGLSAAAHRLFGNRLGAEAVIVGVSWAISTWLVYTIVRRLTSSAAIGTASALLPIVAGARGYSYPKGIVYAVAAALWWRYIDRPTTRRIVAFGTWTAVAFYWRPDHGVYVATGLMLAVLAAHSLSRLALIRLSIGAATTIAWIVPFLIYVQFSYGLVPYVQTGLTQAEVEHESHGTHEWPVLRYASDLIAFEPADHYAPTVGLRWNSRSTPEQRDDIRRRYDLIALGTAGDGVERVRLSENSIARIRSLINEPLIDDTASIDRSAGTLTAKDWPPSLRRKFTYRLLRLQILPALDASTRASEFVAALFLGLPLVLLAGAGWVSRRLTGPPPRAFALFGAFSLLVAWAMIRNPFPARVADAVVLASIAFGCCVAAAWQGAARRRVVVVRRLCAVAVAVIVIAMTAVSGRFDGRQWLQGGEVYRELTASPPLAFYLDRPARFSLRLAAFVRDCVPPDQRLLVLWFEPEIYYFSERLMAQRHATFAPEWSALQREQRATLDKVQRFAPPIVLVRESALEAYARASFPGVVDHVDREYRVAATVDDDGERYLIYARRDRPVTRTFGAQSWPCFTAQESIWARVGRVPD